MKPDFKRHKDSPSWVDAFFFVTAMVILVLGPWFTFWEMVAWAR